MDGLYHQQEIHNLARFISVMKFRPLIWRNSHSYVLVDRIEDRTNEEKLRQDPFTDRKAIFYGYVRGTFLKDNLKVCVAGAGDYRVKSVKSLPDPCPLPDKTKARKVGIGNRPTVGGLYSYPQPPLTTVLMLQLGEKQKLLYAPMSDIGDIIMDADAMYIEIPDAHVRFSQKEGKDALVEAGPKAEEEAAAEGSDEEGQSMVKSLQRTQMAIDERLEDAGFQLFKGAGLVDGRSDGVRRPAPEMADSDGAAEQAEDLEGVASDGDGSEDEGAQPANPWGGVAIAFGKPDGSAGDEEEESEDDGAASGAGSEGGEAGWKSHIGTLRDRNLVRTVDLNKLVYGSDQASTDDGGGSESESDDDLFKPVAAKKEDVGANEADRSKFVPDSEDEVDDWSDEETREQLRNRFVTGDWGKSLGEKTDGDEESAGAEGSDEEVYGDFEDMETGEKFGPGQHKSSDDADAGSDAGSEDDDKGDRSEAEADAARRKAKEQLKRAFDSSYDGGKSSKDGDGDADADAKITEAEYIAKSYQNVEGLRDAADTQKELNKDEFGGMEDAEREKYEGCRVGTYVRIEIDGIPAELLRHHDPCVPIVVGALKPEEEQMGYIQLKLKKHRWHRRILKTNDPLIFSVGWRRFQSVPLYAMPDEMGRFRQIKYTPEHMHCTAIVYGPITPPNTGVICFQNTRNDQVTLSPLVLSASCTHLRRAAQSHFRVSATGTIAELDHSFQVVKKLKLVGTPYKVGKNTAFIRDMFNSQLEVSKFQGAAIRTVSGIRGQIKKPVTNSTPGRHAPPGSFRATFEDKVLMSDLVFLRTWYPVTPVKFYNPVTSLLVADPAGWAGMKTVRELRQEKKLPVPHKADSEYKPIERQERKFNALKVPKHLQAALPFKSKPKLAAKSKRHKGKEGYLKKRAVVLEPHERETYTVLQQLRTIRNGASRLCPSSLTLRRP